MTALVTHWAADCVSSVGSGKDTEKVLECQQSRADSHTSECRLCLECKTNGRKAKRAEHGARRLTTEYLR